MIKLALVKVTQITLSILLSLVIVAVIKSISVDAGAADHFKIEIDVVSVDGSTLNTVIGPSKELIDTLMSERLPQCLIFFVRRVDPKFPRNATICANTAEELTVTRFRFTALVMNNSPVHLLQFNNNGFENLETRVVSSDPEAFYKNLLKSSRIFIVRRQDQTGIAEKIKKGILNKVADVESEWRSNETKGDPREGFILLPRSTETNAFYSDPMFGDYLSGLITSIAGVKYHIREGDLITGIYIWPVGEN